VFWVWPFQQLLASHWAGFCERPHNLCGWVGPAWALKRTQQPLPHDPTKCFEGSLPFSLFAFWVLGVMLGGITSRSRDVAGGRGRRRSPLCIT
jgi:hypothetical protein